MAPKITALQCKQRNRVLAKMNVFFHLKVDCCEILCRVFKPKEFDFAAKFFIYGLDQKLSSCEH